jgi:Family of unknown function (DUF6677)
MTSPKSNYSLRAGVLSYLVPGLGQIYEGRVGKGILFMVCLYGLFFYGMYLGDWKNVHLPNTAGKNPPPVNMPNLLANIYNRPQFAGQFWIGIAAWPAIWQYVHSPEPSEETQSFWRDFQRQPSEKTLNELQAEGDKTWDLAWVYTVIAGALNVLVIYDAVAGPALGIEMESRHSLQEAAA